MQGLLLASSMRSLQQATSQVVGPLAGTCFALLTATQFHLPFYASRPLPNTFALALCCDAYADWLRGRCPRRVVAMLTLTTVCWPTNLLGGQSFLILVSSGVV